MAVQTTDILLGAGNLFAKRSGDADGLWRLIGTLSGEVVFTYTPEEAEKKVADVLGPVARRKIDEHATIVAEVADFKTAELRYALGITKSSTLLTGTQSIRLSEEIATGSTTGTKTLSRTPKSTTSIQITSLDRGTEFVNGTDYTVPAASSVAPLLSGFANSTVTAHYTHLFATAERWKVGDDVNLDELSLMFVHKQPNKKSIAITFHKATVMGDMSMNFNEKEYTIRGITFSALADCTKPKGQRMFDIAREP